MFRLTIFSSVVLSWALTASVVAAERPNVLLVLCDDLGFSDIGCYGGEIRTPNLDQLAARGLRFSQFYNTARCWPTRAALMTGYYAQQVRRDKLDGIRSGAQGERPEWAPLLPQLLAPVGYRCYHSGKWHIDGMPLQNGFHHSYYIQDQGRFFNPRKHYLDDLPLPEVPPGTDFYGTISITDHCVQTLKTHLETHPDTPFFHYLAYTAPHFPLQALPGDIDRYADQYQGGWEQIRAARHAKQQRAGLLTGSSLSAVEPEVGPPYNFPEALKQLGAGEVNRPLPWESLTAEQKSFQAMKMSIHAAMVDRVDQEIGRVLRLLDDSGCREDTLIIFLSDNGASAEMMIRDDGHDPAAPPGSAASYLCLGPGWSTVCNTPFRRHKTWVHEGGIATPAIFSWPSKITDHGAIRHRAAHVVDIMPTLLEICGVNRHAAPESGVVHGQSLAPLFRADDRPQDNREIWWQHEGNRAIRVGDWKLVAAGEEAPWELYDLSKDRTETHNLAADHPDLVQQLALRWAERLAEFRQPFE